MGIKTQTGFTIIETMLFLAVTGALAAMILVGSGVAIGQQRYRDSVSSLRSYIQQQYSNVTSVSNDRDASWTCNGSAQVSATKPSGGESRGTSDCVILGRFLTIDATGTKLSVANVIGVKKPNAKDQSSDIAEITTNYTLAISPVDQDSEVVNWGAKVAKQKTSSPMPLSVLILRSPLSGSVMTFTAQGVQTDLMSLVTVANMNKQQDLCVDADPGSFVGKRMEIRIGAYAADQTAIQIPSESDSVCD